MMNRKAIYAVILCLVGTGVFAAPDAKAQRWLQTSQLFVELQQDGPGRALLDTLVQVVERSEDIKVKRSPESNEKLSISDLRDKLINEKGIGLNSASHVFIDYKFMIENRGFEESIEAFKFIFRQSAGAEDIQMMYVDANEPWVREILRSKGTTLRSNQAALKTFSDQLAFARMHDNGKIVEISGNTVREGFERKKRKLVEKITRLTYGSM